MYNNLYVSAPYILGSTLRGVILSAVIHRLCPPQDFASLQQNNPGHHAACAGGCGAKPLFDTTQTRFTFGFFEANDSAPSPRAERSKVAIARNTNSVAEGALLALDIIPAGSKFTFDLRFPAEIAQRLIDEAVAFAGEFLGVGRFRKQGFGRFEVEEVRDWTPRSQPAPDGPELQLRFRTPYVVGQKLSDLPERLASDLSQALGEDRLVTHLGTNPEQSITVTHVEPGYIGRWCYEDGQRHTRAVCLPDTTVRFKVQKPFLPGDIEELGWGIGEWSDCGFGALEVAGGR